MPSKPNHPPKIRIPIRLHGTWSQTLYLALPHQWREPIDIWKNGLKEGLKNFKNPLFLSVHHILRGTFKRAGFEWELRQKGEAKIGLWRKKIRTRDRGVEVPKRLVVIPGFGDTPLSWLVPVLMSIPAIRADYDEVIFFDFPGFSGFLSREKCFSSMDALLEMASDTLDSLKPYAILGHSLGGWVASHYAGKCGERTRPLGNQKIYSGPEILVVADPSGVFDGPESEAEWEEKFTRVMDIGFEELRPHVFSKEPFWFPFLASEYIRFISKPDVLDFMRTFRKDHATNDLVTKIRAKTWVIWGDLDTLCPTRWIYQWLKILPSESRPQGILLKKVGHSPQIECPALTALVLAEILRGKVPSAKRARRYQLVEL